MGKTTEAMGNGDCGYGSGRSRSDLTQKTKKKQGSRGSYEWESIQKYEGGLIVDIIKCVGFNVSECECPLSWVERKIVVVLLKQKSFENWKKTKQNKNLEFQMLVSPSLVSFRRDDGALTACGVVSYVACDSVKSVVFRGTRGSLDQTAGSGLNDVCSCFSKLFSLRLHIYAM